MTRPPRRHPYRAPGAHTSGVMLSLAILMDLRKRRFAEHESMIGQRKRYMPVARPPATTARLEAALDLLATYCAVDRRDPSPSWQSKF